jgi:hypothetical protein
MIYERRGAKRQSVHKIAAGSYGISARSQTTPQLSANWWGDSLDQGTLFEEIDMETTRYPVVSLTESRLAKLLAHNGLGEQETLEQEIIFTVDDWESLACGAEDLLLARYGGRRGYLIDQLAPLLTESMANIDQITAEWLEYDITDDEITILDVTAEELDLITLELGKADLIQHVAELTDDQLHALAWDLGIQLQIDDEVALQEDIITAVRECTLLNI